MTRMLVSDTNADGMMLEEVLKLIRRDILVRCSRMADDPQPEARKVLNNNMRILPLLTEAIELAEDSTRVLGRAFGRTIAESGEPPPIHNS